MYIEIRIKSATVNVLVKRREDSKEEYFTKLIILELQEEKSDESKKLTALALATIMGISSITIPTKAVKAEEIPQEYVVVAKNDIGYEEVEETYNDEISLESVESEVLKENNIAVVELTEVEAENLEKDKNILIVEEDIILSASAHNVDKKTLKKEKKKYYEELQRKK